MKKFTHTKIMSLVVLVALVISATPTPASRADSGPLLREGLKVTKKDVVKVVGKRFKKCQEIGKTIRPIKTGKKKGKFLLHVNVSGKKVKKYYAKVDALKKLNVNLNDFELDVDEFSLKKFKANIDVRAVYKSGKQVLIKNFKVTKKKSKNVYSFTVSFCNKKKKIKFEVPKVSENSEVLKTELPVIQYSETPKSTATPEPTATPKTTSTPEATETPEPTVVSNPTTTPESTATPKATETPEPTVVPNPTTTPEPTVVPNPTTTPEPTVVPNPTTTPEQTTTPESTSTPEPIATPEQTATPKTTATPEVAETPEPTATPKPTSTLSPTSTPEPRVTLKIRKKGEGNVFLNDKEIDFVNNVAEKELVPANYQLKSIAEDGWYFVNYVKGTIENKNSNYNLSIATNSIELEVNFAETAKTVKAVFTDDAGTTLLSAAVVKGDSIAPPTNGVYKSTKDFQGWKFKEVLFEGGIGADEFIASNGIKLSDAIKTETAKGNDIAIVAYYTAKVETFTVSVIGGTITRKNGVKITDAEIEVDFEEEVYVSANVPEGKYFVKWVDAHDNKITSFSSFTNKINSNICYKAVFEEKQVEKEPEVYFTEGKCNKVDTNTYAFDFACDIPAGYEKLSWGLLMSTKVSSADEMTIDNANVTIREDRKDTTKNALAAFLKLNLTFKDSILNKQPLARFRVYATIKTPLGETKTIYSECLEIVLKK